MGIGGAAVVALGVLLFALLSKRLEGSIVTLPIVFVALGWLIGSGGLGIAHLDLSHGVVHVIAEVTLVLVLFADATRIDLKRLIADHNLPQRMLLVGLPLIIVLGAAAALILFPGMSWAMAFLLAAILAPTDAALGQSVVSNRIVPVRIRQALNVESGLNDGIVLPVVLIFAILAGGGAGSASASDLAIFTLKQVALGPAAGIVVGILGALAINQASGRDWMTQPFEGIAILSIAALAFVGAELVGGNGFIGAFVGGLVFWRPASRKMRLPSGIHGNRRSIAHSPDLFDLRGGHGPGIVRGHFMDGRPLCDSVLDGRSDDSDRDFNIRDRPLARQHIVPWLVRAARARVHPVRAPDPREIPDPGSRNGLGHRCRERAHECLVAWCHGGAARRGLWQTGREEGRVRGIQTDIRNAGPSRHVADLILKREERT